MNEYDLQVKEFCKKTDTKILIRPNYPESKVMWYGNLVNYYRVEFNRYKGTKRFNRQYVKDWDKNAFVVYFHDSIHNTETGKKPTKYSVLASLQKYDVGDFEEFCREFGYDVYGVEGYNKESYAIYSATKKEWENVNKLWGDCLDELREIV